MQASTSRTFLLLWTFATVLLLPLGAQAQEGRAPYRGEYGRRDEDWRRREEDRRLLEEQRAQEARDRAAAAQMLRIQAAERDRERRLDQAGRERWQRAQELEGDRAAARASWVERQRAVGFRWQVRREERARLIAHRQRWRDADRRATIELRAGPWVNIDQMFMDEQRATVRHELRRHARRTAYLSRMLVMARELHDPEIAVRVDELITVEQRRFERRMNAFGVSPMTYPDPYLQRESFIE